MIYKLTKFLSSKDIRVFLISIVFHASLYLVSSNTMLFLLSMLLLLTLYQHLKKLPLTLFYAFLILLPFAKGKGIDIILLNKEYVLKNAIFNVDYLFPIYISSFFLGLFYNYQLRNHLFIKRNKIHVSPKNKFAISMLLLFIVSTTINSISSIFKTTIFLSSMQIIVLLSIFLLPFFVFRSKNKKDKLNDIYMIIASSTLFQSLWLIAQTINKGYLNRDIEVYLPGVQYNITSSENSDLARLPGTFFESSILGTFLVTNLSIMFFLLINNKIKNEKMKKIIKTSSLFASIAIIFTGSRAIYLILMVLLLIVINKNNLLTLKNIKKQLKKVIKRKFVILYIVVGIFFISPYLLSRIQTSGQLFSKRGSGTYRIELAKYSLRLTKKKPFLGVGLNMSPYYLATSFPGEDYFINPAYPHNIIIQLLAETGIIGTILFLAFLYLVFRPSIIDKSKFSEFHLASIIFFLSAQIYPIFINHMEIISYLFLYLGFAAKNNQNEK